MRYLLLSILLMATLFGSWQNAFLPPEEAFKATAELNNDSKIDVNIDLGKSIYLYEDKMKIVDALDQDGIVFQKVETAVAEEHDGEKVHFNNFHASIDLAKETEISGQKEITLELSYQGCSEQGLCYEPMTKRFTFSVDSTKLPLVSGGLSAVESQPVEKAAAVAPEAQRVSETDEIAKIIQEGSLFVILLSFLGFGLLLSLTPCVFPMIPILSSVIVAQGEGLTMKKAFMLSLTYVLAMSVAYTLAGVLAGLFGANLQAAFQTTWVIVLFSLIFVILSLSMFDLYELQVPNFIQSRVSKAGEGHSGYVGVAIMGFLSALIVGPCIAAPLAGALIYIGQTGDALLGGMALFTLSIGMGIPLLIIGTSAGKFMPKPGAWMDMIKFVFGVLLLGVAIWMLSRVVSAELNMILWALLLVFTSVNLGAFEPLREGCVRCAQAMKKTLAILLFMYGVALFIGGLSGNGNVLQPLSKLTSPTTQAAQMNTIKAPEATFKVIHTIADLDAILATSKGKKVMLDFYADWCTSCKEMEHITFADPAVKAKMATFVLVQADVTANTDEEKALTKKFGLFGPPGIIFYDENGQQIAGTKVIGYQPPEIFLAHLNSL